MSIDSDDSTATSASADPKSSACVVSSVTLYRLPVNLRLDSIDFEQCILDCVRNRLTADTDKQSDSGLNKRIVSEIKINPTDLQFEEEGDEDEEEKSEETEAIPVTTNEDDHQYMVCIHASKLLWTVVSSEVPTTDFDIRQHQAYLQTCFDDIQLCYVNFQLPNVIIWLLSSIPLRVVKNESLIAKCHHNNNNSNQNINQPKNDSLFALVWKCFDEHDVVRLREIYKHLRSAKKLKQSDSISNGVRSASRREAMKKSHAYHHHPDWDSLDRSGLSGAEFDSHLYKSRQQYGPPKPPPPPHYVLHRQRHPARLIQEGIAHIVYPFVPINRMLLDPKQEIYYVPHKKSTGGYPIVSESEFDTTQMSTYMASKRIFKANLKGNLSYRIRSRSVESPRQRLRFAYKPINDNYEIILPTNYNLFKSDSPATANHGANQKKNVGAGNGGGQYGEGKENKESNLKEIPDSLNSEGSSLSGESTSGEYSPTQVDDECFKANGSGAKFRADSARKSTPVVVKSVLKKSTSHFDEQGSPNRYDQSSPGYLLFSPSINDRLKFGTNGKKTTTTDNNNTTARQYSSNYGKKNVTFSAYATIQVMDS